MEHTKSPANYGQTQELIERYMEGKTSGSESAAAQQWLQEHVSDPAYDELFAGLLARTPVHIDNERMRRVRQKMESMVGGFALPRRSPLRLLGRIAGYVAAAAIAVILMVTQLMPSSDIEWLEEYTPHGQTAELTLPDGTSVWLNSGTRVFYPSRFGRSSRSVYVDGEIFADVVKDERRPFTVSVSGVKVEVLGTRFGVKSYAGTENVEVTLEQGSVALRTASLDHVLVPGEMVRYNTVSGLMESYTVDPSTYGAWNDNLCFLNHTLAEIAADLERRFNVRIIIEDANLAATQYYASFINNESLDQILRALDGWNTMSFTRIENTIVISPK